LSLAAITKVTKMGSIELKSVRKDFAGFSVINGVDLHVEDGEFTVFVGPSGCGKSTLLRLIAGLEDISSGQILIDGIDATNIGPAQRGLAMVFQSYALYPHMSVRGNIAFALKMAKQPADVIEQKVKKAAATLNLTDYLDRKPRQLSGGQRQRVAIGRAIVREPKAFLFDEPLSNLDASLRVQMRLEIGDLHNALKTTMIYVTHDQVEAMTMADKIVVLDKGTVAQVGSPLELYNKPNGLFVARFIGSPTMNLVTGPSAAKRGAATIGIRPEHLGLSATEGEWPARVRIAEHLGSDTFVYAEVEGQGQMTVRVEGDAYRKPGDLIYLIPQEDRIHKFDIDGKRIA
jgi:multiple sugar transport system ATP-binding protein